jgi:hypothetical protein
VHCERSLHFWGWDTTYYYDGLERVVTSSMLVAASLRDDIRSYLPELLPRFIGLFAEAERSGVLHLGA